MNYDIFDQIQDAGNLALEIRKAELQYGHERTVLVGDLNMNPFDPAVVGAKGLHGVMTKAIANKRLRIIAGVPHHFFYNPMWGLLGDRTPGPAGTYHTRLAKPTEYFWNTFDQVLIRPDLVKHFDDVSVLSNIGEVSLLTQNGLPDRTNISDHLPITFRLNLQ